MCRAVSKQSHPLKDMNPFILFFVFLLLNDHQYDDGTC